MFEDALTLWRILDPNELLGRHQHLLTMGEEESGTCSTLRHRVWIADIKSAMEAKKNQQG